MNVLWEKEGAAAYPFKQGLCGVCVLVSYLGFTLMWKGNFG